MEYKTGANKENAILWGPTPKKHTLPGVQNQKHLPVHPRLDGAESLRYLAISTMGLEPKLALEAFENLEHAAAGLLGNGCYGVCTGCLDLLTFWLTDLQTSSLWFKSCGLDPQKAKRSFRLERFGRSKCGLSIGPTRSGWCFCPVVFRGQMCGAERWRLPEPPPRRGEAQSTASARDPEPAAQPSAERPEGGLGSLERPGGEKPDDWVTKILRVYKAFWLKSKHFL